MFELTCKHWVTAAQNRFASALPEEPRKENTVGDEDADNTQDDEHNHTDEFHWVWKKENEAVRTNS